MCSLKSANPLIKLFEKLFDCIKLSVVLFVAECQSVLKMVGFGDELVGCALVEE